VPVATARDLEALVPVAALDGIHRSIVVDPAAAFPPAAGDRVAVLRVSIPGRVIGTVPLLVTDVPDPPAVSDEPWWERAAGALTSAVSSTVRGFFG
jgi:hypothetical protein